MTSDTLQSLSNQNFNESLKAESYLGFLDSVSFVLSDEKVKAMEFPTHLFGCPTSFCIGEVMEEQTPKKCSPEAHNDAENASNEDDVFAVKIYPRADEFKSDLSVISEGKTERTLQTEQSQQVLALYNMPKKTYQSN